LGFSALGLLFSTVFVLLSEPAALCEEYGIDKIRGISHLATTNRSQTFRRMAAVKIGISATLSTAGDICPLLPKMHTGNAV